MLAPNTSLSGQLLISALLRPRHFDGDTISPGSQNVKGGAQPMTHCSLALPLTLEEGLSFSSISDCNLLPWRGETRSAGPNFSAMRNWGKNRLGRSPLRTSLGVRGRACVKPMVGPSPLLWLLVVPPHQATLGSWPYGWVVSPSGPTLARRCLSHRQALPYTLYFYGRHL